MNKYKKLLCIILDCKLWEVDMVFQKMQDFDIKINKFMPISFVDCNYSIANLCHNIYEESTDKAFRELNIIKHGENIYSILTQENISPTLQKLVKFFDEWYDYIEIPANKYDFKLQLRDDYITEFTNYDQLKTFIEGYIQ